MSTSHIKPQPVVVVEPRHDTTFSVMKFCIQFVMGFATTFLYAFIAWWLGPIVFPELFDLTYWQTFALLFLLRAIIPRPHSFRYQSNATVAQPKGN